MPAVSPPEHKRLRLSQDSASTLSEVDGEEVQDDKMSIMSDENCSIQPEKGQSFPNEKEGSPARIVEAGRDIARGTL
ncbi:hypothetical protein BDN67DRAFT_1014996 [Paxillus ammoniavirescens]|nr:hypothetical protein BDN67DRAFT_1014996 [Paxillus ammoniavirescens]